MRLKIAYKQFQSSTTMFMMMFDIEPTYVLYLIWLLIKSAEGHDNKLDDEDITTSQLTKIISSEQSNKFSFSPPGIWYP